MKSPGTLAVALLITTLVCSCRRPEKKPTRTEPWLASARGSASASPVARRAHYVLGRSRVDFELPARRANPNGRFRVAEGRLDVDLDDLSRSTGQVTLDLMSVEMRGGDGVADPTHTEQALEWLELGARLTDEKRNTLRRAVFEIRSLDAGHLVSIPNEDSPVRRRELLSNWAVKGELSLHGVRAPTSADVSLTLVPGPRPAGPPAELIIRSRRPLVIELGTHDIRPREARGVPVTKAQAMLGDSVGRSARLTFELTFVPQQ